MLRLFQFFFNLVQLVRISQFGFLILQEKYLAYDLPKFQRWAFPQYQKELFQIWYRSCWVDIIPLIYTQLVFTCFNYEKTYFDYNPLSNECICLMFSWRWNKNLKFIIFLTQLFLLLQRFASVLDVLIEALSLAVSF